MAAPVFHMLADAPRPVAPISHAVECEGWRPARTCSGVAAPVEIDLLARRP